MNNAYRPSRSLEELDGVWPPDPEFTTGLIERVHKARKKPLNELTVEDLRTLIGQQVGLPHVMPLAIAIIERNPLAEGDFYPGDLLSSVVSAKSFLLEHPDMKARTEQAATKARNAPISVTGFKRDWKTSR
jgi:hypothetical protein